MQTESQTSKTWLISALTVAVALWCGGFALQSIGADAEQDVETAKSEGAQEKISDEWKEGLIEGAYLFNTSLNNFKIDVDVVGNMATLSGNVDNSAEKALAEQIALSIDGIDRVESQLVIGESAAEADADTIDENAGVRQTLSDAAITTKVKSRLLANGDIAGMDINVDTDGGHVTLTGDVDTETEKELAYYLTRNTDGVVDVRNRLRVEGLN